MPSPEAKTLQKKSILFHYLAMAINALSLVSGILLVFFGGEVGAGLVQTGIILVAGGTVAFLVIEGVAVGIDRRVVELLTNGGSSPDAPRPQFVTLEDGRLRIHYE